jgi:hypothetical protein
VKPYLHATNRNDVDANMVAMTDYRVLENTTPSPDCER